MTATIIANDAQSKQNAETVLAFYDELINKKQAPNAVEKYLTPDYIQHNPIVPTTAKSLGEYFGQVAAARQNLRVVIHRVIASGDYVWAHVNFINILNDEADDRGFAGVDIYRFDANGKIAEHWDVVQEVPDPKTAANTNGMF
jgi:predicted SnoaL-like aldol condensation-catalyzing enzyme